MKKKLNGISLEIPVEVYNPAEDSILLAENIKINVDEKILEIGSGSGFVSIFLAKQFPKNDFFCLDINPMATDSTRNNAKRNNVSLNIFLANLMDSITDVSPYFDVILFNSPYLPVKDQGFLGSSWSGGEGGLETIEKFLLNLVKNMKKTGRCYLVVSSKTDLKKLELLVKKFYFVSNSIDHIAESNETIHLFLIKF